MPKPNYRISHLMIAFFVVLFTWTSLFAQNINEYRITTEDMKGQEARIDQMIGGINVKKNYVVTCPSCEKYGQRVEDLNYEYKKLVIYVRELRSYLNELRTTFGTDENIQRQIDQNNKDIEEEKEKLDQANLEYQKAKSAWGIFSGERSEAKARWEEAFEENERNVAKNKQENEKFTRDLWQMRLIEIRIEEYVNRIRELEDERSDARGSLNICEVRFCQPERRVDQPPQRAYPPWRDRPPRSTIRFEYGPKDDHRHHRDHDKDHDKVCRR